MSLAVLTFADLSVVTGGRQEERTIAQKADNSLETVTNAIDSPANGAYKAVKRAWNASEQSVMNGDGYWKSVRKTFQGLIGWE